jgi:hypothetical protein
MANGYERERQRGDHANDTARAALGPYSPSDAHLLDWAARALYGSEHSRVSLARLLQVNRNSLTRWVNGKAPIPPGVWLMLRGCLAARVSEQQTILGIIRDRFPLEKEASNVATNEHD